MKTLQIRVPEKLLKKVDELIESGFFRSRSEILRQALQEYIIHCNYNASLPFIVGPFSDPDFDKFFKVLPEELEAEKSEIKKIKQLFKNFEVQ
ncbi:MAG: ribbon-helix-helix protein, CopG family [Promethearchaeota archaeon]|nr:MAG: ribbon-helix-helix protein, CopG family [Candidatus Lokiarchaeota archaeon]